MIVLCQMWKEQNEQNGFKSNVMQCEGQVAVV